MLTTLVIAVGVLLGSWAMLVYLAARLPPGLLKDLAGFLPACATFLRRLSTETSPMRASPWALKGGLLNFPILGFQESLDGS